MRFSTGVMRVEPDRRTITLPVVGALRSMENTRRLERLVHAGRVRILNATLKDRGGRLFVSLCCLVENHLRPAPTKGGRAGVDLGLRVLATIADSNGDITDALSWAAVSSLLAPRARGAWPKRFFGVMGQ